MKEATHVSFLSAPGGVGKTTIALCLGWFLRKNAKSVLLTDMDPSLGLTLRLYNTRERIFEYKKEIDDKQRTAADFLEMSWKGLHGGESQLDKIIHKIPFKDVSFDFIPGSIRLEDTMSQIWYSTGGGHAEKYLEKGLNEIQSLKNYDYILIDTIPCYAFTYSIQSIVGGDVCIVPLRATIIDLYRTLQMMKKLERTMPKYDVTKEEFYNKMHFVFNIVDTTSKQKDRVERGVYKEDLEKTCMSAYIFDEYIEKAVAYDRIGTKKESRRDENRVEDTFRDFYEEFISIL